MQCHSYTKYVAVLEFKPLLYREMFHHISGVGSDHFTDVTSTVVTSRCERKLYFDTFFPRQHDSFLLSSLDFYDSNFYQILTLWDYRSGQLPSLTVRICLVMNETKINFLTNWTFNIRRGKVWHSGRKLISGFLEMNRTRMSLSRTYTSARAKQPHSMKPSLVQYQIKHILKSTQHPH